MNKKNKKRISRVVTTTLAGSLVVSNIPLNVFAELMTDEQGASIATDLNEQEVLEQEISEVEAQEEAIEDEEKEVSGNQEDEAGITLNEGENIEIEPEIELEQEEEIKEEQSEELSLEEVDKVEESKIEELEPQEIIVEAQEEIANGDNSESQKDKEPNIQVAAISSGQVTAHLDINHYQPFFAIKGDMQKYEWLKVSEDEIKSRRIGNNESTEISSTFTLKETTTISIDYRASSQIYDYGYIYLNGSQKIKFSGKESGTYTESLAPGTYTIKLSYKKNGSFVDRDDAVYFSNFKGVDLNSFVSDYQVEYEINNEGWMPYKPIVELPFEGGEVSIRECLGGNCKTVFAENFDAVSKIDVNGYSGGDGSQASPYLISTAEELGFLAYEVNSLQNNTSGKYYQLTNDIDLSEFDSDDNENNGNWTPIGGVSGDFEGVFDGQYYKVLNLEINDSSKHHLALFGGIKSAEVKNLAVIDAKIHGSGIIATTIASAENSNIENLYASGTVDGLKKYGAGNLVGGAIASTDKASITNAHADVDVDAEYNYFVGGLIGSAWESKIQDSSATGNVTGAGTVGGLIGDAYIRTEIEKCYAEGDVSGDDFVGGFIGDAEGTKIRDSYALGAVSGRDYNPSAGGFIGELDLGTVVYRSYSTGKVPSSYYTVGGFAGLVHQEGQDCYWDVETSGATNNIGTSNGGGDVFGAGLTTAQMTGVAAIQNMQGFDFDNVWSTTSSYPILKWQEVSEPIVVNEEFTTYVGDDFDVFDYIQVESPNGLDLTIRNVKGEVDTKTVGTYTVTFTVIDSHWNQTEHSVEVHVVKKPAPVIEVEDVTINVGDKFNALSVATVHDEIDKDIKLEVIEDNVDENTPGEYTVTYRAVNSLGEVTIKSITVTVVGKTEKPEENKPTKPVEDNDEVIKEEETEEKPEPNKDNELESKPIIEEQDKEQNKEPVKVETGLATSGAYLFSGILLTVSGFISSRKRK